MVPFFVNLDLQHPQPEAAEVSLYQYKRALDEGGQGRNDKRRVSGCQKGKGRNISETLYVFLCN